MVEEHRQTESAMRASCANAGPASDVNCSVLACRECSPNRSPTAMLAFDTLPTVTLLQSDRAAARDIVIVI